MAIQDKTTWYNRRQVNAMQYKTIQHIIRQYTAGEDNTRQSNIRPAKKHKTRQYHAKQ